MKILSIVTFVMFFSILILILTDKIIGLSEYVGNKREIKWLRDNIKEAAILDPDIITENYNGSETVDPDIYYAVFIGQDLMAIRLPLGEVSFVELEGRNKSVVYSINADGKLISVCELINGTENNILITNAQIRQARWYLQISEKIIPEKIRDLYKVRNRNDKSAESHPRIFNLSDG